MTDEGITVALRLRPLNSREKAEGQCAIWACLPQYASVTQLQPDGTPVPERSAGHTFFTYDKVFGEDASTREVYDAIAAPLVKSVVQGINGTVFAYGQTSSGKTFTMQGYQQKEGILYMAAHDIFEHIAQTSDRDFLLRVSFVEIYNENVRDLLTHDQAPVNIREDPRKGVYIDASEMIITSFDQVLEAQRTGELNRRVESTAMNERSSRSHTIFRIVVESRQRGSEEEADGAVLVAALNLVDLAGSESVKHTGATGQRAKEGGKINQSLLSLSRVIHSLSQGGAHVNFRDSKLTRILQPSLSGNARMAVVCCVTPAEQYLEESRSTLQFAARAKMVRTHAVVNEVLDDRAQLHRLKKELTELKEQQRRAQASASVDPEQLSRLEQEKAEIAGKIQELQAEREAQEARIERLKELIVQGGKLNDNDGEPKKRTKKRARGTWCPGKLMESLAEMHQQQHQHPRSGKAKTVDDFDLDVSGSANDFSGSIEDSFVDEEQDNVQRWRDITLQLDSYKRKNEILTEKLESSNQQLAQVQQENQALMDEYETQLTEANKTIGEMTDELMSKEQALQAAQTQLVQLAEFEAKLQEAAAREASLQAELTATVAELEQLQATVSDSQQRAAEEQAEQLEQLQQEIAQLKEEAAMVEEYEAQLTEANKTIDEMTDELMSKEQALQAAQTQLVQLAEFEAKLQEAAAREASLQAELTAKIAELEQLQATVSDSQQRAAEQQAEQLEQLQQEIAQLKEEATATEEQLAEANSTIEQLTEEFLQKEEKVLEETQAQLERLADTEAKLQEAAERELALQAELTAKTAELGRLQSDSTDQSEIVARHQAEVLELQQEIAQLKEEVRTVEEASVEAIKEYEEQLTEANKTIEQMTDELMGKQQELQQMKGELDSTRSSLEARVQEQDAVLQQLQGQLASAGSNDEVVSHLEKRMGELKAHKLEAEESAARLLEKVNDLNEELYAAQEELKTLKESDDHASLVEAAERIEQLEQELEEAEAVRAQLEDDLNEVHERLKNAQKQKADVQGEWERTCSEVDELRQLLSDAEQQLAILRGSGASVNTQALLEEVAALREASHAADARVLSYHQALEESKAQVVELQDQLKQEQQTVAQLRVELEHVSTLLEEELKDKDSGRANDEEMDKLLEEMNVLAEEKLRAESHVTSLKEENSGLRKQLAEYDDKSAKEQRMLMSMAETEMSNLQQKLAQKEQLMADLSAELERQRAQVLELSSANDEIKRDLSARRDALRELEMEAQQLRQDLQFRDESLNDKEESLAAAQNEIYRLRHELQAMAELQNTDADGEEQSGELVQQLKEQLRTLQFEMEQKNQRILKLEEVKMTKDKLEKLQKMKDERKKFYEENKALKQELKQLRAQVEAHSAASSTAAAAADQDAARKIEELQRAKDQLSEKLRKYAQHCKDLESERIAVLEALKRAGVEPGQTCEDSNIDDSAVEENLADLVNLLSAKVRGQSGAASSSNDSKLNEAEDRAARYLAELQEVQGQKLALEHRTESLQKRLFDLRDEQGALENSVVELRTQLAQKTEELEDMKRQSTLMQTGRTHELHTLEEENLELMQENKTLRKELLDLRAQLEVLSVKGGAARSAVPGLPSGKVTVSSVAGATDAEEEQGDQENVKPSVLNTSSTNDTAEQQPGKRTSLASMLSPAGKGASSSDAAKRRRKTREALVDLDNENQQECQQS